MKHPHLTFLILLSIVLLTLSLSLAGCGRSQSLSSETSLALTDSTDSLPLAQLTAVQRDSLEFRLRHHYGEGFNFRVTADSLPLLQNLETTSPLLLPPEMESEVASGDTVLRGDLLVVAEVARKEAADSLSPDTFWIKVAHDQLTQGWVEESELLQSVVPNDSISQLLHSLTYSRGIWMSLLVLMGLLGFIIYRRVSVNHDWLSLLRHSDSWYAPLLISLVVLLAVTYASVQLWVPEFWQEYYFHPTLNPLLLPGVMCWLMVLVWLIIITFIALIIEVYHRYYFLQGLAYIVEVLGMAMVGYLFVSWAAQIYVGYLLAPLLIVLSWRFFLRRKQS